MALTLSKKCAIEEKSTIDMEKENNRKKVDSFVNSCDYDIKEGDLDMLVYRVYQFNQKYKNLDQDVILGLFKKAWVENNPILKWILESMDEKTLKSAFGEWGKEKQFFDILKKYGITEYWCSKEFDPSEDITVGSVFLPTDDAAPALEIYDLYTRIDVCPDEYCPVTVTNGSKDSETFNIATNDLERREVN